MPIKEFKPVTPGLRQMTVSTFEELTRREPEKALTEPLPKRGGRNVQGHVTARHRGGGHKRLYRRIDFKRTKDGMPATIREIEYDPNRSARIALIQYQDGTKAYILWPVGLKVGETVVSGGSSEIEIKVGNCLPLQLIPTGTIVHNVELTPGRGAQIVRSAGAQAEVMAKEGTYAHLKLPSGEVRLVLLECRATIGQVGNVDHNLISFGKAGRLRHLGMRPRTRGVAMNPVDHPHGGGEGRSKGGRPSMAPWGWMTKGMKTRRPKKLSDRFILARRGQKAAGSMPTT